jgi:4-amino-4-deoxy-L-arabinose transferase-like glycosyltransferase
MTRPRTLRHPHVAAFGLLVVVTLLWTFWAGKDASWDVLNHHLYLPFSATSGRFATDFFAAGPQSYQNPLGYFPAYALIVGLGWPSWAVGAVLAAVHSGGAFVSYRLAARLWASDPNRTSWVALATAMAWVAPAFLLLAGTTSIDPIAALAVLAALALAVEDRQDGSLAKSGASGALLGVAFAVKQSNAVFAISIAAVLLLRWAQRDASAKQLLTFAVGVIIGIVVGMGWWSVSLWRQFGNPIFPLFNNVFHSAFAADGAVLASRFIPAGPADYITRLWEIARPKQFIWIEPFVPDLRLAALAFVAMLLGVVVAVRKVWPRARAGRACLGRLDAQLAVFVAISYVLWMGTSGNARYALPLLLVVGLLLVRVTWAVFSLKVARVAAGTLLVLQFAYFVDVGDHRYKSSPWDDAPYLDVRVPSRLVDEPFLHLPVGLQTHASVAPFFNANGAMMNPIGQWSLRTDGVVGERVQALLKQWHGRTRILLPLGMAAERGKTAQFDLLMSKMLYRLGLDIDWTDCLHIAFGPSIQGTSANKQIAGLYSCMAKDKGQIDPTFEAERPLVDAAFKTIETSCPSIFGPAGTVSERGLGKWQRFYPNTDAIVTASFTEGVFVSQARTNIDRPLGTIDELIAGKTRFKCQMWSLLAPD